MDRVRGWWGRVANVVAGVEVQQYEETEDDGDATATKEKGDNVRIYLVTYGSYGPLPSFDPDCLTAMVSVRPSPPQSPNPLQIVLA